MENNNEGGAATDNEKSLLIGFLSGLIALVPVLAVAIIGQSTTLLADFLRTFSETLAIFLAWLSLRKVRTGATEAYNYGLGKLENISSLLVAGALMVSFLLVTYNAAARLIEPRPVGQVEWGILLFLVVAAINLWFWKHNQHLSSINPSPIMESQWRLFRGKFLINLGVITSLVLSFLLKGFEWSVYIDVITSFALAGFLLISAWGVAKSSVTQLLDQALEERLQIIILRELAVYFNSYEDFHGLQTRQSGKDSFITIFLEFAGDRTMADVQAVINDIQLGLERKIKNSHVYVVTSQAKP